MLNWENMSSTRNAVSRWIKVQEGPVGSPQARRADLELVEAEDLRLGGHLPRHGPQHVPLRPARPQPLRHGLNRHCLSRHGPTRRARRGARSQSLSLGTLGEVDAPVNLDIVIKYVKPLEFIRAIARK